MWQIFVFFFNTVLGKWGWDISRANLRLQSPELELHSRTSTWIAIVHVWIHPLSPSVLDRNEQTFESLFFPLNFCALKQNFSGFQYLLMLKVLVYPGVCAFPTFLCVIRFLSGCWEHGGGNHGNYHKPKTWNSSRAAPPHFFFSSERRPKIKYAMELNVLLFDICFITAS